MIFLQIRSDEKHFPPSFKAFRSRINSIYSILFSNLKQNEPNIIIIRKVISSHMGPMYIETRYIIY